MAEEKAFVDDSRMPNELLYGRAGFLWACLFVNNHIGEETIPLSALVSNPIFDRNYYFDVICFSLVNN